MQTLIIALGLVLAGCSPLLVREDDKAPVIVSKVAIRTMLGVSTLGVSELNLANQRDELNTELKLEEYREHLTFQVNNDVITQAKAEELYLQHSSMLFQHLKAQHERRMEPINAVAKGTKVIFRAALCMYTVCLSELLLYRPDTPKGSSTKTSHLGPDNKGRFTETSHLAPDRR